MFKNGCALACVSKEWKQLIIWNEESIKGLHAMLLIDHVLGLRLGLGCHQRSPGPTSLCKKSVAWTHIDFCKSLAFAVFVKIRELDLPVTCQKFSRQKCKQLYDDCHVLYTTRLEDGWQYGIEQRIHISLDHQKSSYSEPPKMLMQNWHTTLSVRLKLDVCVCVRC
jgi:hypothetical protein